MFLGSLELDGVFAVLVDFDFGTSGSCTEANDGSSNRAS